MKIGPVIPERILRLMSKQDRDKLHQKTADELNAIGVIKYEKDLHKQVGNLLRLRGIEFIESRMDRKTTQKRGVPDFLFTVAYSPMPEMKSDAVVMSWWPIACAWECKILGKTLDPDQKAMFDRLTKAPNAWTCRVIHSVQEALDELRKLGL